MICNDMAMERIHMSREEITQGLNLNAKLMKHTTSSAFDPNLGLKLTSVSKINSGIVQESVSSSQDCFHVNKFFQINSALLYVMGFSCKFSKCILFHFCFLH